MTAAGLPVTLRADGHGDVLESEKHGEFVRRDVEAEKILEVVLGVVLDPVDRALDVNELRLRVVGERAV